VNPQEARIDRALTLLRLDSDAVAREDIVDAIADLLHLADAIGEPDVLETAEMHHDAERNEA